MLMFTAGFLDTLECSVWALSEGFLVKWLESKPTNDVQRSMKELYWESLTQWATGTITGENCTVEKLSNLPLPRVQYEKIDGIYSTKVPKESTPVHPRRWI